MREVTTKEQAQAQTYGPSYSAAPYDSTRCVASVWDDWSNHQCHRKPGHGPAGLYCKQHDPAAKAARDAKRDAAWDAERKAMEARERLRLAERAVIDAAVAATRQAGTWDAVADAVLAMEQAKQEARDGE